MECSLTGCTITVASLLNREGISASSFDNWTPVLAIGSNAGVSQLARKFAKEFFPEGVVLPVVQVPGLTSVPLLSTSDLLSGAGS